MIDSNASDAWWMPRPKLQTLIESLQRRDFEVIGPTIRDSAIVYDPITSASQLPAGWTDRQSPATYRIEEKGGDRQFFFNSSPDSWKKYLFPAKQTLSGATLTDKGWTFVSKIEPAPRRALLGVRACDLAAIAIQDRVFLDDEFVDPVYAERRQAVLIIAVQCSTAAPTCFCTSMDTGPACSSGFDLALTESDAGFYVQVGSPAGQSLVDELRLSAADSSQTESAKIELENARNAISKNFDTEGVRELLLNNLEHAQWQDVASRCLSCTNCTMVCPTCFCSSVDEVSDLDQTDVTRVRQWDSCFDLDFSYTAGGTVRNDIRSRYRQWLTHKLATWHDQFETSGCTGCGRCITWCPVGIDLTEEVAAIRGEGIVDAVGA
tara:strand:- start:141472 stop:142605 length:1134 start_codon:yes stop_codon:yes gene_type:complete